MFNTDDILRQLNQHKANKINTFLEMTKKQFINDVDATAKIYTRDKGQNGYTVCKLKSGTYALVKNGEIIYRNDDVHLCKVEFIVKTKLSLDNSELFQFINKL